MTTTSADNGASAGDGGSGDRGWFTPTKPQADDEAMAAGDTAQRAPDGAAAPDVDREQGAERGQDGGPIPSSPLSAMRPVGSGATRAGGPDAPGSGPIPGPGPIPIPGPAPELDAGPELAREHPAQAQPQPQSPAAPAVEPSPLEPSDDALLIRRTMDEVEPRADAATAYFYALLFVQHPQLRDLFPASMDAQRDRLFRALLTAVRFADDTDVLARYLSGLGRGHRKYGTLPEHYPAVGECLLGALSQYATTTWSDEAEEAWVRAYTKISQVMIDAAAEDAQRAPAWWHAEIVSHEQRTPQVAVITVRPELPYPFRAGQYTSVETPWWPRVWRHYSFASAPRSDGLLTFHVKSVPAGWVSSALVHRARPGDVLRLGPPAGGMTVEHTTDSGLLCLGGGTGIAPIKAMVEDIAQQGRERPVEVFYGARIDQDLYDLDTMLRLEQQHGWLAVRPVVAVGRGPQYAQVLSGELPDAVRQHGPWPGYDGYLSGPPGMIRSSMDALVGVGIPAHRIRHDSVAELVSNGD